MCRAFLRALLGIYFFATDAHANTFAFTSRQNDLLAQSFAPTPIVDKKKRVKPSLEKKATSLWEQALSQISATDTHYAQATLLKLLRLIPDFYPSADVPPKIMTIFQNAQRQFQSEEKYRANFAATIVNETALDNKISLIIHAQENLLALVREIAVHIKTRGQSAFRSVRTNPNKQGQTISVDFIFPAAKDERLDYFLEFIGNYDEPFYSIYSATSPRILVATKTQVALTHEGTPNTSLMKFKTGWPILLSAVVAVAGLITYGLLKMPQ